MTFKVTYSLEPNGTTRLSLTNQGPSHATPLPRDFIADGHVPRPHPDVVAAMSWLCWPRFCKGVIAYGQGVSTPMAEALSDKNTAIGITPHSVDHRIPARRGVKSTLALSADGAPRSARNVLGNQRVTYLAVKPIGQWRGRLLSTDSLTVSSNAEAFAEYSWPSPGNDLGAQLAAALLFSDMFRANKIVAADFQHDGVWETRARSLLAVIGIELILTRIGTPVWSEVVES